MSNQVLLSVDYIPNPSIGKALALADIYVGIVDLDPKIVGNQKQISVLQENGTTVQVTQPITTSAGGVPLYNGSPVTILVDGSYSLRIDDSTGAQEYYVPKNAISSPFLEPIESIADLRAITTTPNDGEIVSVVGYYASTENKDWWFQWVGASIDADNSGTIIKVASITTGRWVRIFEGPVYASFFGLGGAIDDYTATNNAYQYAATVSKDLIINAGDHDFSVNGILMISHTKIMGEGGVDISTPNELDTATTNITYTGTGAAFSFGNGTGNGVRGATLEHIALFGDDTGDTGILVHGTGGLSSSGNVIKNVNINNFATYGIDGAGWCFSNELINVGIHDSGTYLRLYEEANDWVIIDPDFSSVTTSDTDIAIEVGGGGSDCVGVSVYGGAIQNVGIGLNTNSTSRVLNFFGTYFEDCKRSFNVTSSAVNFSGCVLSGRSGENYIGEINAGSLNILGGQTFGTIVIADIFIAGGSGTISPATKSSTAPLLVSYDAGQPDEKWAVSDTSTSTYINYSDFDRIKFLTASGLYRIQDEAGLNIVNIAKAQSAFNNTVVAGKTASTGDTVGAEINKLGYFRGIVDAEVVMIANRLNSDGALVTFQRDTVTVGEITVAGGVITYGTFCGSHITQIDTEDKILVGTVLSVVDELCVRSGINAEYLPKTKISDIANDKNVYGVYLGEDSNKNTLAASIGTCKIRINKDYNVSIGDYLMSNGDGTAVAQDDDILRSSTIAKVTGTTRLETYSDGSYLVSCTLHCG